MKFRGVQRSVRSQRFDRSAGDAPSIGRVARLPGTGLPKGERRKRRRGERGGGDAIRSKQRQVMLTWSLILVLLALSGLGTAVWFWLRQSMNRETSAKGGSPVERVIEKRVASRFESPTEREALDLVRRALSVRDPASVAEYFRPGAASPEKVIGFLRNMEVEDGAVEGMTWLSSMDANGLLIDGVLVKTIKDGQLRNRLAFLTPDEKGKWKIDFDGFARTVEPSWGELLEGKAGEGLVRVIVAADSYYNGPFRDESQWVCYGMVSPDTEVVMLGYCRKGSAQAEAMAGIVSVGDSLPGTHSPRRATLKIRRIEGAESRQFEIARVMAEDWVMSVRPFDGNAP